MDVVHPPGGVTAYHKASMTMKDRASGHDDPFTRAAPAARLTHTALKANGVITGVHHTVLHKDIPA